MISGVYIFLTSGIPIFHANLGKAKENINEILFAGISSAISSFIKELAHSDLESINVEDGTLKYSIHDELIFVVHTREKKADKLANFLIKQMKMEFLYKYGSILRINPKSVVESSLFYSFDPVIREIYINLSNLFQKYQNLFNFIPEDIPLSLIEELVNEGDNLIKGFPHDTIRLIRRLDKKYEYSIKERIMFSLGVYFGSEISKKKFSGRVTIGQSEVLKLLNEISVTKLDIDKLAFVIKICPICRGRVSDRPICQFFSGFIEGCFDNPRIHIIEKNCKARGDQNCTFAPISNSLLFEQ